jgi:hypothetical protein
MLCASHPNADARLKSKVVAKAAFVNATPAHVRMQAFFLTKVLLVSDSATANTVISLLPLADSSADAMMSDDIDLR